VKDAITCEKKLKGWRRKRKIALIEQTNLRWLDLSDDWEQQPKFYEGGETSLVIVLIAVDPKANRDPSLRSG
jgi:hypothetical protein